MFNFLWWFVVGPIVGWLVGKVMRSAHNGWFDVLAGLFGAIAVGTFCELAGISATYTPLVACFSGGAGALIVTFIFCKVIGAKAAAIAPRAPASRSSSYTSYKSRMGK
jgi:uncharacterized membrane protein YeaQ/YmgE (transglycosylase-associated protein family)